MMSEYNPDAWVIVEIWGTNVEESPYHRVFAGWYGGFTHGDSWKMNSGITKILDQGTHYDVYGDSGSVYRCPKHAERMSGYMTSIYRQYTEKNCDEISLKHVSMSEILERYVAPFPVITEPLA
jgi:hypothetical protein